jgi:phosphohistidine phosphatase SixA
MNSHPTSGELLDAVTRFLEERVAPQMKDRDAFLVRVAVNALATVKRQGEQGAAMEAGAQTRLAALLGHEGSVEALNHELCEAIRTGAIADDDAALLTHLKASTIAQVQVDQPNYSGLKAALGPRPSTSSG